MSIPTLKGVRFYTLAHLLNLVRHRRVHQSEQQVPQGPGLSTQDTGGHASSQGQSEMIGQEPKAQFEEVMMFPAETREKNYSVTRVISSVRKILQYMFLLAPLKFLSLCFT